MAILSVEINEEKLRTAQVDPSAAKDIQAAGAKEVRAFWRIAESAGGHADQLQNMKAQHSDNGIDWTDVPGGAFTQVTQGATFPKEQILTIYPVRKWLRWTQTTTATTLSSTWGLEVTYIS